MKIKKIMLIILFSFSLLFAYSCTIQPLSTKNSIPVRLGVGTSTQDRTNDAVLKKEIENKKRYCEVYYGEYTQDAEAAIARKGMTLQEVLDIYNNLNTALNNNDLTQASTLADQLLAAFDLSFDADTLNHDIIYDKLVLSAKYSEVNIDAVKQLLVSKNKTLDDAVAMYTKGMDAHKAGDDVAAAVHTDTLVAVIELDYELNKHYVHTLVVDPDKPEALYTINDTVTWTITGKNNPLINATIQYRIKKHGLTIIEQGEKPVVNGKAVVTATLNEPGALFLEVGYDDYVLGLLVERGGAMIDYQNIAPSMEVPADFNDFWNGKVAEMNTIPLNIKEEFVEQNAQGITLYKVTIDSVNNTKLRGYLSIPNIPGRTQYPVMIVFPYYDIRALDKKLNYEHSSRGFMTFNVMAHDLEVDLPDSVYADLWDKYKHYPYIGQHDREKSYFLRMYLNCYRAVEYTSKHSAWDGKTIFTEGSSQGGGLAMVAAALHPKVTHCAPLIPGMCDNTALLADRLCAWPNWYHSTSVGNDVLQTCRYYDMQNFGRLIQAKVLMGGGVIDWVCSPAGIAAVYNLIPSTNKQILFFPKRTHGKGDLAPWYSTIQQMYDEVTAP